MASGSRGGTCRIPSASGKQISSRRGKRGQPVENEEAQLPQHRPGGLGSCVSAGSNDRRDLPHQSKRSM